MTFTVLRIILSSVNHQHPHLSAYQQIKFSCMFTSLNSHKDGRLKKLLLYSPELDSITIFRIS